MSAGTACSSGALEMAANCTWCMATWASHGSKAELRRLCSCATSIQEVSQVLYLQDSSVWVVLGKTCCLHILRTINELFGSMLLLCDSMELRVLALSAAWLSKVQWKLFTLM